MLFFPFFFWFYDFAHCWKKFWNLMEIHWITFVLKVKKRIIYLPTLNIYCIVSAHRHTNNSNLVHLHSIGSRLKSWHRKYHIKMDVSSAKQTEAEMHLFISFLCLHIFNEWFTNSIQFNQNKERSWNDVLCKWFSRDFCNQVYAIHLILSNSGTWRRRIYIYIYARSGARLMKFRLKHVF